MNEDTKNNKNLNEFREIASKNSAGSSSNEILEAIIKETSKLNKKHINKILDVGCGQGDLLNRLSKQFPNAQLYGIDYSNFEKLNNDNIIFKQHDCNENLPKDYSDFDLIISSEVIEHLENGRHFLRSLSNSLNENGTIIISTPNLESITSIISFITRGHHSAFWGKNYPAHITPIAACDLQLMIKETGSLSIEKTYFINNGRIPGSNKQWKSIFPAISGKRFSDNYFIRAHKSNNL